MRTHWLLALGSWLLAIVLLALSLLPCGAQPQRIINRLDDVPDVHLNATNTTPGYTLVQQTNAAGVRYWTNAPGAGSGGAVGLANFESSQFTTNGGTVAIKNGPITTNLNDTGTTRANAGVFTNALTLLTNPIPFGVMRADLGGTNFNGTTNLSDLLVTNATFQNVTINNNFTVNGKNGMSGTLTAGYIPMAGTASIFSNSIAQQNGLTDITLRGSLQVTNNIGVNTLVVSNTASGITPTAGAHFATKGYVDVAFVQNALPMPAQQWLVTVCYPRSDSATLVSLGEVFTATGTPSANANTATKPGHLQVISGTVLGNIACWESGQTAWTPARTNIFDTVISLDQVVSNRFWAGYFVANAASTFAVDDPNAATAAWRFSPQEAGDTALMAFTQQDVGATAEIASTGLTMVSNTIYALRIETLPLGTVKYYTNGVLAHTSSIMPTNTALWRVMWGVSTRVSGANRALDWWGTAIEQSLR